MPAEYSEFARQAHTVLANISDLLDSPDPRSRVRAVHHLSLGTAALERWILLDAQASGMTWAEIARVYGISRQAAHRRFSDETIVSPDFFHELLNNLTAEAEAVPPLPQANKRSQNAGESG